MADSFVQPFPASENRKEWMRLYNSWYRMTHRKELNIAILQWKKRNPLRNKISNDRSRERIKIKVQDLLGSVCKRCGFTDRRALQVDHIQGVGGDRRSLYRCGTKLYAAILRGERDIKLFQLLCANCNWIKRYEMGEHNGR